MDTAVVNAILLFWLQLRLRLIHPEGNEGHRGELGSAPVLPLLPVLLVIFLTERKQPFSIRA